MDSTQDTQSEQATDASLMSEQQQSSSIVAVDEGDHDKINADENENQHLPSSSNASHAHTINEALYSRQLYVLGKDAQRRLQQSRVLLCGEMNGLAIEIGKNLALAGVKALALVDTPASSVTVADLSANFYVSPDHIASSIDRAEAVKEKLQELNNAVPIITLSTRNSSDSESKKVTMTFDDAPDTGYGHYQVVVCINAPKELVMKLSSFCHEHQPKPIAFISTGMYGLYTYAFSDFGPEWEVLDPDGEPKRSGIVLDITNDGIVTTSREKHHGLSDGDFVCFEGIEGLAELNDGKPRKIECVETEIIQTDGKAKKIHGQKFKILDEEIFAPKSQDQGEDISTTSNGDDQTATQRYKGGGYFEQVKIPLKVKYHSLEESLKEPAIVQNDFLNFTKPQKLHLYLQALWAFQESKLNGSLYEASGLSGGLYLPNPGSNEDTDAIIANAEKFAPSSDPITDDDKKLFQKLGLGAAGQLNPVAAFMGGIIGQEVLKACTGKFTPLNQWLHFSFEQCLSSPVSSDDLPTLDELYKNKDVSSIKRYDGQAAVFGRKFQEQLSTLKFFVVGAGALGCETLKNLALMGVACDDNNANNENSGKIIVTDMDAIETSNLNRQFLFREKHIGKLKSETAASVVNDINPNLKIEAMKIKVAPDTEIVFDDNFWTSLDGVINCLDNIPARLYVDSQCVFYGKPLLESGTLGTKCNTLPVVPDLTESYGSDPVRDESEDIPACTLHAYPNLIEHTLAWAREALFEREFHSDPVEAKTVLDTLVQSDFKIQPTSMKITTLQSARMVLSEILPIDQHEGLFPYHVTRHGADFDFAACVKLARLRFEEYFSNKIKLLLAVHPQDKVDAKGVPFWSGERRAPTPTKFNANDPMHMLFVISAARLYASVHGTPYNHISQLDEFAKNIVIEMESQIPEFVPNVNVKIAVNDAEAKELEKEMAEKLERESQSMEKKCSDLLDSIVCACSEEVEEEGEATTGTAATTQNGDQRKPRRLTGYPLQQGVKDLMKGFENMKTSDDADDETAKEKQNGNVAHHVVGVYPQEFEKDDESNGHMDFVYSAACIRARSYKIPEVDKLRARQIVGRIIPAIATTTACATGAVGLELYKLVQKLPLESYRAANINLAVNSYSLFEPTPAVKYTFGKKNKKGEYNLWSNITLKGDLTVNELMKHFKKNYNFEVMTIATSGDAILFNDMFASEKDRKSKITDLFTSIVKKPLPKKFIRLGVDGDYIDSDDEDSDEDEDDEDEEEDDDDDDEDEDEDDEEEEEEEIKMPTVRLEYC